MTDFLNGRFYISISTKPIEDKNKDIWGNITYQKQFIRLSDLRNYISNNYAFCGVFTSDTFSVKDKTETNWLQTNIICVDLDDRKMPYNEFIDIIKDTDLCPNIAYRTANDGIKGNRYRLIYALDDAITNSKLYNEIYWGIIGKVEEITNDKNSDNCCQSVAQQICGTIHTDDIYFNDLYYSVKCFKEMFGISTLNISDLYNRQHNKESKTKKVSVKKSFVSFDFSQYNLMYDDFAKDFNTLSFTDIMQKYNGKYYNYEQTQLEDVSEDIAYIEIPNNYTRIKRYWYLEENALNHNKCCQIRKIKDGDGRRKKLYVNAIIRRLIYPQITFDNLLFNIIFEFNYYMINNGNKINRYELFSICQRAFNADITLSKYQKYIIGKSEKSYVVNPLYCIKYNVSKNTVKNIAKKQMTYKEIGNLYDASLSDKENVNIMQKYGLNIKSTKTLQRWRNDNNITKWDKVDIQNDKEREKKHIVSESPLGTNGIDTTILDYYQKGYTIRQIADITNISKSKVYRIIKANKVQSKTINIKEEERNIYTCNDTFSNDVIKENNSINKDEVMIPKAIEFDVIRTNIERKKKPYIKPSISIIRVSEMVDKNAL